MVGLADDVTDRIELARTGRLLCVFNRYPSVELEEFLGLVELEISTLGRSLPMEANLKRLFAANVIAAVGIAVGWSAFAANMLGADLLKSLWAQIVSGIAQSTSTLLALAAWSIYGLGLLAIGGYFIGRYRTLLQQHRLHRLHRTLKLHLCAVAKSESSAQLAPCGGA
ncbi:MAG TPA: hypothetical protein VED01_14215 [Burkholderiales bacterium]|nr:hypothetical protein [Burkholderiales bacterium]